MVTGSAGFIGASFCYEALKNNHKVLGVDNYSNSSRKTTRILKNIFKKNFSFLELNLAKSKKMVIEDLKFFKPDLILHFAALKSISAAEANPDLYWENNINATTNLLNFAEEIGCSKFIFSSSAAVYGENNSQPVNEESILKPESIYGKTKLECENLIKDFCKDNTLDAVIFRFFNVCGCHKDKFFYETSKTSQNLMMNIIEVANKRKERISIYGNRFSTNDGSATRDYVHIEDLLSAHFKVISMLKNITFCEIFNLGSEKEVSVLEFIKTFEETNGIKLTYKISEPRPGELPRSLSDTTKLKNYSNWRVEKNLKDMCLDSWIAQKK